VEDEAYHGFEDRASHAAKARTNRTEVIFGPGGFYYVYFIYGIYWNLNIVSGENEFPSAVLIRALEPVYDSEFNLDKMSLKEKKIMASGPGRLCRWLEIDKSFYGKSVESDDLFIVELKDLTKITPLREGEGVSRLLGEVGSAKRVGVDYAKESADWDWRYFLKDNPYVSR
jgi:DNA-3-methyladenine glycosylase